MYILSCPVCISMVLNLLFLCNIVRVLLVKLRAGPHVQTANRPSRTAVQALRATLLLVPLLGLNYLLTPFRPPKNHSLEKAYDITAAITASFQGLSVTVLFCFCNGEVISQVKRKWKNLMFRPRTNSCTATTVSVRPVRQYYVAGEEKIGLQRQPTRNNCSVPCPVNDTSSRRPTAQQIK
ncbi:Diuretic hormone 31 Receptor [Carabus blaptoides fortunei]